MGADAAAMPMTAISTEPDNAPMMVMAAPVAATPTAMQGVTICLNPFIAVPVLARPEADCPKTLAVLSSAPCWPVTMWEIRAGGGNCCTTGHGRQFTAKGEVETELPAFAGAMLQERKRENRRERFLSGGGLRLSTLGSAGSSEWKLGGRWHGSL